MLETPRAERQRAPIAAPQALAASSQWAGPAPLTDADVAGLVEQHSRRITRHLERQVACHARTRPSTVACPSSTKRRSSTNCARVSLRIRRDRTRELDGSLLLAHPVPSPICGVFWCGDSDGDSADEIFVDIPPSERFAFKRGSVR